MVNEAPNPPRCKMRHESSTKRGTFFTFTHPVKKKTVFHILTRVLLSGPPTPNEESGKLKTWDI